MLKSQLFLEWLSGKWKTFEILKIVKVVNCKGFEPIYEVKSFSQTIPSKICQDQSMKSSKVGLLWKAW